MADNINVDPGTGVGAVPVATDDVSGVQYQIIKIATGGDGAAAVISSGNPLPVSGTVSASGTVAATQSGSWTVAATQSGTWNVGSITTLPVQFGAGSVSGTTQRVTIAADQLGTLVAGAVPVVSGGYEYESCPISATTTLGATGALGDYLECLLCVVDTAATSLVQIKDGSDTAIDVLPNNAGVGTHPLPIGLTSRTGAWQVITLAGTKVLATGNFT